METYALLLASITCCLSAAPALAANGNAPVTVTGAHSDDPDTIRVSYRDLDLGNEADAATLRARVKQAARETCSALYEGSFLSQDWACQDVAWRAAAPQIRAAIASAGTGQNLAGSAVVLRFARR